MEKPSTSILLLPGWNNKSCRQLYLNGSIVLQFGWWKVRNSSLSKQRWMLISQRASYLTLTCGSLDSGCFGAVVTWLIFWLDWASGRCFPFGPCACGVLCSSIQATFVAASHQCIWTAVKYFSLTNLVLKKLNNKKKLRWEGTILPSGLLKQWTWQNRSDSETKEESNYANFWCLEK